MEKVKKLIDQNRLTNCFAFRDEIFENLKIGKMQAYIKNDALFIFQTEELGFYKFYYFVNDLEQIELAKDLLEKYYTQGDVSLEFTTKRDRGLDELRLVLERLGFYHYDTFHRLSPPKKLTLDLQSDVKNAEQSDVKNAEQSDVPEIYKIITSEFEPLIDRIASVQELEKFVGDKSIFIQKDKKTKEIIYIQIYEFQGSTLYSRMTWIKKEFRKPRFFIDFLTNIVIALNSLGLNFVREYGWCSEFNRNYKVSLLQGYNTDGVRCYIFTYKKERIIKNKRKKYESKTQ